VRFGEVRVEDIKRACDLMTLSSVLSTVFAMGLALWR
jgi:hypothetical protein